MNQLDKWGRDTFKNPYYGLTLGYQEWFDDNTKESAVQVRILDCTHKIFLFELHFGKDGERVKTIIDKYKVQIINQNVQDFSVIWTWVKRIPLINKLVIYRKIYYYRGTTNKFFDIGSYATNIEGEIGLNIRGLNALLNSWQDIYRGRIPPEIPEEYHAILKRLEWECKKVSEDKDKCIKYLGNWRLD